MSDTDPIYSQRFVDKLVDEVEHLKEELADWLAAHPPSLCSAHQVLDLSCCICNPALREVERLNGYSKYLMDGLTRSTQEVESLRNALAKCESAKEK